MKVSIYDMLGQKVDTLVNNVMTPEKYSITWNAADYSSGLYFYRLEAGSTVITRKMTFVK